MKHKDISGNGSAYLLAFDEGDEIKATLTDFVDTQGIDQASFTAIGALSSVELIAFDVEAKRYRTAVALDEQCELAGLTGNMTRQDGAAVVHVHAVIGRRDGSAHAGHLKQATVRPTCELVLTVYPVAAHKAKDDHWGISLYAS